MNPTEIRERLKTLAGNLGERGRVWVSVDSGGSCLPVSGSVYTNWPNSDSVFRVEAETWPELLDLLDQRWTEYSEEHTRRMIQKMALEIIRITAEQGECTDAALRGFTFTAADVEAFGRDACSKADEMANNGPFSIITLAKANAA